MAGVISIRLPHKIAAVRVAGAASSAAAAGSAAGDADLQARAGALVDAQLRQLGSAIDAVTQAAEELEAQRQQIIRKAEGQMVDLAVNIARKVLMQEIQAGRYDIDPIVREALASVQQRQGALVRLNPSDLERCELARQGDESGTVKFVGDASIPPAHCTIETVQGQVVSTVEGHLQQVAEALKELT